MTYLQDTVGREALDNLASNLSQSEAGNGEQIDWKERRHSLRHAAGSVIGGRTAKCGCCAIGAAVDVVQGDGGGHHFNGLETCSSVWTCPVCAVKITEGRRTDVKAVLESHLNQGGKAAMFTLTIPHSRFDEVSSLRRAVSQSWTKVQQGAGWKAMKARAGWIGAIRALEVTHGNNGWHPHLHVVVLFSKGLTEVNLNVFSDLLFDRWSRAISQAGFGRCSKDAFSCEPITDAEGVSKYCQKWGVAEELTKAHIKKGRAGGRSPWQILSDIQESNTPRDRALFAEYASAFKGARQLTWTNGLRDMYLDVPEPSDADLSDEPACADLEASRVLTINREVWKKVARLRLQGRLLSTMDRDGVAGVLEMLRRHEIPYSIGERRGMYGNITPSIT